MWNKSTKIALFRKGQEVKVINENSRFFDEIAIVLMFDNQTGRYLLEIKSNDYKIEVFDYDIVAHLNHTQELNLLRSQFNTLAQFAVEIGDKTWFLEICRARDKLFPK